ncbi:hypothetical protein AB0F71_17180 [Kitasatospora sp. NPDC028055]|uniref:hypothetical protein n=1 Tax=Kitasatospora sp. NPDC028055 TaxID=3155653 RepID=UPI0033C20F00
MIVIPNPVQRRPGRLTAVALLAAALALTACGTQRATQPTAAAPTTPTSTDVPSATPYAEPGAGDGAPHYRENNGSRIARDLSPAAEQEARREANRIEPVLKGLWESGTWDPASVRTALLRLGYPSEDARPNTTQTVGALTVRPGEPRFTSERDYVTPEGASISLRVRPDACVIGFVQPTNYQVRTSGPYPETGCFEPPFAH